MAYTFDAGPNAVLISHNRKAATLLLQRLLYYFPPQSDTDLDRFEKFVRHHQTLFLHLLFISYLTIRAFHSYVIGDKTILKDAGINEMKDVEALTPPPETTGNTSRNTGDVSYYLH